MISPTLSPTLTIESSPETNDPTPTSGPQTDGDSGEIPGENQLGFVGLIFGALGLAVVGGAGYATVTRQNIPEEIRLRCVLLPIVGGLLGYNYLALDLPGASGLLSAMGPFSGFIVAIITGASAFVFTQIWCQKHITEKK